MDTGIAATADESERVTALHELQLLDTPAEERFDRITRMAARLMGAPVALVSLVDRERVWFKSAIGIDAAEVPREVAFCSHTILTDDGLLVEDLSSDPRFAHNPLVANPPRFRFYAGLPLTDPCGRRVGSICVLDLRPRSLSVEDRAALRDLATLATDEVRAVRQSEAQRAFLAAYQSLQRKALLDPLTKAWNRGAIVELLERELAHAEKIGSPLSVLMLDIDHFKQVNDRHGHLVGDCVIREVARRVRCCTREMDAVGRYGGEEFLVLLPKAAHAGALDCAERIRRAVASTPVPSDAGPLGVTISIGAATCTATRAHTVEHLIRAADEALYAAKGAGRNRVHAQSLPS